ncbi:MAG: GntR family transcriptional regulator [Clostridiaceae bacterium]
MPKLVRTSIKEQVYEILKDKILKQELDWGQPINIVDLSKELSVSNTPIREALSKLEAEGLVTSSHNTKFKVIVLTEEYYTELNQAVMTLCTGCLDLCVLLNHIDKLIELLNTAFTNQKQAFKEKDYDKFAQCALNFDKAIIEATNNQTLISIFNSVSSKLLMSVKHDHNIADSRNLSILEHEQIFKSINSGDYDTAKKLLTIHYDKHILID